MSVRFAPRARRDFDEILAYIAEENSAAAVRVHQAIFRTIDLIGVRPHVGTRNARASALRSLLVPRYPYRVHYTLRGRDIWILHIRHTARRPWPQDS